ncbi:MAG TPA: hypothetical protein V6D33_04655 [Cyanophyceae cyanobacterium]
MERLKLELAEVTAAKDDFFDSCDCAKRTSEADRYAKRIRELETQAKALSPEKRDRILAALGVGKQSPQYKRVKAALDQMML